MFPAKREIEANVTNYYGKRIVPLSPFGEINGCLSGLQYMHDCPHHYDLYTRIPAGNRCDRLVIYWPHLKFFRSQSQI